MNLLDIIAENKVLQIIVELIAVLIFIFFLRNMTISHIEKVFDVVSELDEQRQELVIQAEEYIDEGWVVSLDGHIIESPVDLSFYHIKLDEESKTVILTTPVSTNSNERTYTHTPIYFPIPIIH